MIQELLSGTVPFASINSVQVVFEILEFKTPARPGTFPTGSEGDVLWALCQQCWHRDPYQRPTLRHIQDVLEGLLSASRARELRSPQIVLAAGPVEACASSGIHQAEQHPDNETTRPCATCSIVRDVARHIGSNYEVKIQRECHNARISSVLKKVSMLTGLIIEWRVKLNNFLQRTPGGEQRLKWHDQQTITYRGGNSEVQWAVRVFSKIFRPDFFSNLADLTTLVGDTELGRGAGSSRGDAREIAAAHALHVLSPFLYEAICVEYATGELRGIVTAVQPCSCSNKSSLTVT